MIWQEQSTNIIDVLCSQPSSLPFWDRVLALKLSTSLMDKIEYQLQSRKSSCLPATQPKYLTIKDEKELGTEMLLVRHQFTEQVFKTRMFRQAALSVIQNIYLFRQRKIFFGTAVASYEQERQEALLFLSKNPEDTPLPLSKTFQHLIIARIWNRITNQSTETSTKTTAFIELNSTVEKLNTLRNIYMILSLGLVQNLVRNINPIYRQSISFEDAVQIGTFGIARAAYRYHSSSGVRFSTFAANWVRKEIQRQSLDSRLIRISSTIVERYAKASKVKDQQHLAELSILIKNEASNSTSKSDCLENIIATSTQTPSPALILENKQQRKMVREAVDKVLTGKLADIIKRRYGLQPYKQEESVIEIGKVYGVTRGSIYQLEQTAFKKLEKHFIKEKVNL